MSDLKNIRDNFVIDKEGLSFKDSDIIFTITKQNGKEIEVTLATKFTDNYSESLLNLRIHLTDLKRITTASQNIINLVESNKE